MKNILFDCQYCYVETIVKYDSELHEAPQFCPHCGRQADDEYEELEFDND